MSPIQQYTVFSLPWDDPHIRHGFQDHDFDFLLKTTLEGRDFGVPDDDNDLSSQSTLHGSPRTRETNLERLRHEQKHLRPIPPAYEHSIMDDSMQPASPWTLDGCPAFDAHMPSMDEDCDGPDQHRKHNNTESNVMCADCGRRFDNYTQMETHGKVMNHLPFRCEEPLCWKQLARRDTMQRHIAKHKEPQFSCPWCKDNGVSRCFTRKDHCKTHEGKCSFRPAHDNPQHRRSRSPLRHDARRNSAVMTSTTPTLSFRDAELKKKKIREFMGPMLARNELQAGLDTLGPAEMHGLYDSLTETMRAKMSVEMRRIRSVEVGS